MKRFAVPSALLLLLVAAPPWGASPTVASGDPHAYFDALVARGDHWKSFSFRPRAGAPVTSPYYEHQLARPKQGGYAVSSSAPLVVTYDPGSDPDPNRQDAAKVVIPAFSDITTLAAPVDATQTVVTLTTASSSLLSNGRALKIGSEIMTVVRVSGVALTGNNVPVVRGQYGTQAAAHAVGTTVSTSQNSLANQVRVPLGTSDGNTYLFTWDGYWTSSYINSGLTNHKAFQFTAGDKGDQWLEPQTRFDGGGAFGACTGWDPKVHVAGIEARSYNRNIDGDPNWSLTSGDDLGPGTTSKEPIGPKAASFCIGANTWTRFWVRVEQRANDYDYVDMWVADENRNPVQIYKRIPLSVRPVGSSPNSIPNFWIELNTSTTEYVRGSMRDLVAYVRNFAALVNPPADVSPLLLRPSGGVPPPFTGPSLPPPGSAAPAPPKNLRIIK